MTLFFKNIERFILWRGNVQRWLKGMMVVIFFLSATSCKKYPENTLWLKNPKKINPFYETKFTKYSVNGIDSLNLLNSYFGHSPGLTRDFNMAIFKTMHYPSYTLNKILFDQSYTLDFGYTYTDRNRKIKINLIADSSIYAKNLFISSETEWEILRLERSGPFRIKTTLENGNIYEIEID